MKKEAPPKPIPVLELHRKIVERFSSDADTHFFDTSKFPWVAEIEANWKTIRRDLDVALAEREKIPQFSEVSSRQQRIADERWKTLFFYFYGRRIKENCERFPETDALLRRIPNMTTAMFSILEGNAHIPSHHGPFKGVLRYHLGLLVPVEGEACCIRVDDEVRSWSEGKSLIFDDTFEHEVWNRDARSRVVLFVDFLRPMPPLLSVFNRGLLTMAKYAGDVREIQNKASRYART